MGSSAKRKKEKQKDFQVRTIDLLMQRADSLIRAETQAQGRQGQGQAGELHGHQLPIQGYAPLLSSLASP